ncbi:helix-turn-helix domain-containing protein [Paenibacillus sp. OK003]|uniref:helix-turn-helix domain-containing protein n=1 Tax=Paenibacillus sp. OK003 TaxID=1884380 RepID=UPI0008BB4F41|nr:helix-turn-helix domain-containing protein [Paenibacillus sp. OK003]SEK58094.1 Helix-turn-helix domain-containing protein [Paenibacillus sp. OK003]
MKRKIWFYRQLLSYIPVFFIIVTFIFFVYYQLLSSQSRKEAEMANESMLIQAMNFVDSSLQSIEQGLLSELLHNNELFLFWNATKPDDDYLNIQVAEFIRRFKQENPLVDSIYVARTHDPLVISNAAMTTLEEYPDAAFIHSQLSEPGNHWTGLRKFEPFSVVGYRNVVSLVLKSPVLLNGEGLLVVNLSPGKITDMVNRIYDQQISYTRIMDAERNDILAIPGAERDEDIVVSRTTSTLTGWTYLSGPVNGNFVSATNKFYKMWFAIGVCMIVAGVAWFIYITRKSYRPIEQIISRISSFPQFKAGAGPQENRDSQDEFSFIESALNSILAQTRSYQQQYREDLQLKKTYLLQQLLEGQYPTSLAQWDAQREVFQLNDLRKTQVVCAVEIDEYARFYHYYIHQDQYLLKFAILSVIQETAQKHGCDIWAGWMSGSVLVVMLQMEDREDIEPQVMRLFEDTRTWIEQNMKLRISIGVGNAAIDYTQIPGSYRQALQALKYKMVLGGNQVILYSNVNQVKKVEAFDYFQLVHSMAQSLRTAKPEWRQQFDTLMQNIERDVLDRDNITSLAGYMVYTIEREIGMLAKEYQQLWTGTAQPSLHDALSSSDTFQQLRANLRLPLEHLAEQIQQLQEKQTHSERIFEIRKYIELEYGNPELSLDFLANRFQLSPKSISKLFKETTGNKFVDYVIDVRIKQAQRLLEQTTLSVQEVAEKVGYSNVISFGRAFKKNVHASPGEYRKWSAKPN